MRIPAAFALCALLIAGVAEAADIKAHDATSLAAALQNASRGDRILLAPGAYGDLTIGPRRGRGALTIMAATPGVPPVFRSVFLRDTEEVTLDTLTVIFGATAEPLTARAVEVRRSSGVRLVRLTVVSAENGVAGDDAYGVIIRDSERVSVANSHIHDVFRGVAVFDSGHVAVSGNRVLRAGSDGVVARGAVSLTIENNSFTDFDPVDPARWHPDAIQLWSRGGMRANERIVIRGNVIRRGRGGPAQGIFVKTPEIATRDILVEGNVIEQSMGQGIFVQNGVDVTIRGNVLSAVEPLIDPLAIEVRAPFVDAVVEDNEAPKFRLPLGVRARANKTAS